MIRVRGSLVPVEGLPKMTPTDTREIIYAILNTGQRQRLETEWQIDFAYSIPGHARFRVNAYFQRGTLGAAFRLIPAETVPIEKLGLPPVIREFAKKPRGIVLVTGPTGSGKSTTLASIVNEINETRDDHILTIEDPIEFLHSHKKCIVNQRELGADAPSFALALKAALRQDPDVILVGEMRDMETISTALTAAETGHLVFATLHTQDTAQTVDRIVDVFPPAQQQQVRVQLSVALQGIVTQQLLPTADGSGRVAACEVLSLTPAVGTRTSAATQRPWPSAVGRRVWVTTPWRPIASCARIWPCWAGGNTSMMRSTVCGASWVWSVAKTRCPVSAAVIAVEIVSRSRISPTRMTSGS